VGLRPYDWSPLGLDSDPVPGSPEAVSAESRRLGQTAQELRAQITMLTKIASDTTLKGQYAGTLRAHAQQLSQDLGKVATRYENVADATGEWSGDLAEAQAASLTALRLAEGPYEQLRRLQAPQPPPVSAASAATATAAAQQQYVAEAQQYQQAQSSAQAALTDAQRLLGQATSNRDTAGATAAGKISNASHDALADSWWDQFKQMISGIADNLKTIATVIGYIATVCAVVALILTTGPLALAFLLLAGGLLLTELGIHTILAATGNGSWFDVGLDVFALATLGYGSTLDAGAEELEETAEKAGVENIMKDHPLTNAVKGLFNQVSAFKEEALEYGDDELSQDLDKITEMASKLKDNVTDFAKGAAKEKLEGVAREAEEGRSSVFGVIKDIRQHGSRGAGNAFEVVTQFAKRFPDNPQIAEALKSLKVLGTKNALTFLSGTAVDTADKTLSLASPTYNHFKDSMSGALPEDIGIPVVTAAGLFGPTDFILHVTEFASK
jgi:hypothetical protein